VATTKAMAQNFVQIIARLQLSNDTSYSAIIYEKNDHIKGYKYLLQCISRGFSIQ
jgi:hypothetical protein